MLDEFNSAKLDFVGERLGSMNEDLESVRLEWNKKKAGGEGVVRTLVVYRAI